MVNTVTPSCRYVQPRWYFDGKRIDKNDTEKSLDMEEDDFIECRRKRKRLTKKRVLFMICYVLKNSEFNKIGSEERTLRK